MLSFPETEREKRIDELAEKIGLAIVFIVWGIVVIVLCSIIYSAIV